MSERTLHYKTWFGEGDCPESEVKVGDRIHPSQAMSKYDHKAGVRIPPRSYFLDEKQIRNNNNATISRIEYNEEIDMFNVYTEDSGSEKLMAYIANGELFTIFSMGGYSRYN